MRNGSGEVARVLAVALVVALTTGACVDGSRAVSRSPRVGELPEALTIERILSGTPEENAAFARLEFAIGDLAVQACLSKAGMVDRYTPARLITGEGTAWFPTDLFSDISPMSAPDGWGIVRSVEDSLDRDLATDTGPSSSTPGLDVPPRCETRRFDGHVTFPADLLTVDAQRALIEAQGEVERDRAFADLREEYGSCMETALGLERFDLGEAVEGLIDRANAAINLPAPERSGAFERVAEDERVVAAADAACRGPLVERLRERRAAVERPVIEAHRDEIERVLRAYREVLGRAPSAEALADGITLDEAVGMGLVDPQE
jgi:hypothetical protein